MGFTYNQDSAMKAGGAVRESGAYVGSITLAQYGASAQKGTKFLELTFTADDGTEFKFLTLYYEKADGTEVKGGSSMISAIMGLSKVGQLSEQVVPVAGVTVAPELEGKRIGMVLQKVLYTKNDGTDGFKFEIRFPFSAQTRQTLKEGINNESPTMVDRVVDTLKDKDERQGAGSTQPPAQSFGQNPPQQFGQITGQPAPPPQYNVPDDTFGQAGPDVGDMNGGFGS